MLRYSTNAIISRAEEWSEGFISEPYEAGWCRRGIVFLKTIDEAEAGGLAALEISPDGQCWAKEGGEVALPSIPDQPTFLRFEFPGMFLRLVVISPSRTARQRILATAFLQG